MPVLTATTTPAILLGTLGNDTLIGSVGDDTLDGGLGFGFDTRIGIFVEGNDVIDGGAGNDRITIDRGTVMAGEGDDVVIAGNYYRATGSVIDGGPGIDTFVNLQVTYREMWLTDGGVELFNVASINRFGRFTTWFTLDAVTLRNVEFVQGSLGTSALPATADDLFVIRLSDSLSYQKAGTPYSGPVPGLAWQWLGFAMGDFIGGSIRGDFINALEGDDAVDGGAGDDVIDGGTGANFLKGGAGIDTFFLDGRSGQVTWSTITDWQAGEQLSLWGFRPGVSRLNWAESDGAPGYKGATLHADLDGDGTVNASVTWSGVTHAALPDPYQFDGLLWFK